MSLLKAPEGATKQKKRVGRGPATGQGCTAGKGMNGQNARSGGGVRPGFEGGQMPLYRRIARRGFSNYPFKIENTTVNLSVLENKYEANETVSYETLVTKGVIRNSEQNVKILGNGDISKALTVEFIPVSGSAKAKIEKAGGKVVDAISEKQDVKDGE
jgi:large subunit ribosomal protein L15